MNSSSTPVGYLRLTSSHRPGAKTALEALQRVNRPVYVAATTTGKGFYSDGEAVITSAPAAAGDCALFAVAPPLPLQRCGNDNFLRCHGVRYPVVAGSMAKGISSVELVIAMGKAGMLGCFGAAGLTLDQVDEAITTLQRQLGELPFGVNLIHSPHEQELEQALVELYLRRNVRLVEASAFLTMSANIVRYRLHGIHRGADGSIITPNRVIGKISREEVARQFLAPPPEKIIRQLLEQGHITPEQAQLAQLVPVAEDITAEADSGGHTDNRPALSLFPTICALRDEIQRRHQYAAVPRVGLAGGIACPRSAAAAMAMGADYLVTGSVNQACIESGTCDAVRAMLAQTRQADIAMAPAADMFEMGVEVQVLKRGTMFSMRAAKLYELYRAYPSLDAIPADERKKLEQTFFRQPLGDVWRQTREFFLNRDPRQVERAERDPKHLMALVFRSYLGQATHWAIAGDEQHRMDYQIWCGPAMGAFNEWSAGTFMQQAENRRVAEVNLNILFGAAVLTRANILRNYGVALPDAELSITPLTTEQIKEYLRD